MFKPKKIRYEVNWGCCDGRKGIYTADNVKDLRGKIDLDSMLSDDEKRILKYGYFNEFKEDIKTERFCIDNGFDICWYKYKIIN